MDLFPSSGEGREISTLLGPLERLTSITEPETQQCRCLAPLTLSFRKFVTSSYLEFQTMDKVQKPSDSEHYTPSSEPFRFYFNVLQNCI
jgi:hypothetical protein